MDYTQYYIQEFKRFIGLQTTSTNTIKNYLSDLRLFFSFISQKGQYPLSPQSLPTYISDDFIARYESYLALANPPATTKRRISSLKKFVDYCRSVGILAVISPQSSAGSSQPQPPPTSSGPVTPPPYADSYLNNQGPMPVGIPAMPPAYSQPDNQFPAGSGYPDTSPVTTPPPVPPSIPLPTSPVLPPIGETGFPSLSVDRSATPGLYPPAPPPIPSAPKYGFPDTSPSPASVSPPVTDSQHYHSSLSSVAVGSDKPSSKSAIEPQPSSEHLVHSLDSLLGDQTEPVTSSFPYPSAHPAHSVPDTDRSTHHRHPDSSSGFWQQILIALISFVLCFALTLIVTLLLLK